MSAKRILPGLVLAFLAAPAAACTVSATPLAFGSFSALHRGNVDGVGTITVACPATTAYSISMTAGGSGSFAARRMTSGANTLAYQLHTDASRSVVWGDGTGGSMVVTGEAGPVGTPHNVYGRIPPQPAVVPGTYADTLVVTLTY